MDAVVDAVAMDAVAATAAATHWLGSLGAAEPRTESQDTAGQSPAHWLASPSASPAAVPCGVVKSAKDLRAPPDINLTNEATRLPLAQVPEEDAWVRVLLPPGQRGGTCGARQKLLPRLFPDLSLTRHLTWTCAMPALRCAAQSSSTGTPRPLLLPQNSELEHEPRRRMRAASVDPEIFYGERVENGDRVARERRRKSETAGMHSFCRAAQVLVRLHYHQ